MSGNGYDNPITLPYLPETQLAETDVANTEGYIAQLALTIKSILTNLLLFNKSAPQPHNTGRAESNDNQAFSDDESIQEWFHIRKLDFIKSTN